MATASDRGRGTTERQHEDQTWAASVGAGQVGSVWESMIRCMRRGAAEVCLRFLGEVWHLTLPGAGSEVAAELWGLQQRYAAWAERRAHLPREEGRYPFA